MTTLRLLDIIFAHRIIPGEGSKILIGVILAIIRRNLDTLLQTDGLPEFIDTFRVRKPLIVPLLSLLWVAVSKTWRGVLFLSHERLFGQSHVGQQGAMRRSFHSNELISDAREELRILRAQVQGKAVWQLRQELTLFVADGLERRRYEIIMQHLCPPESKFQNLLLAIRVCKTNTACHVRQLIIFTRH